MATHGFMLCVAFCAYCIFRYKKVIKKFITKWLKQRKRHIPCRKVDIFSFLCYYLLEEIKKSNGLPTVALCEIRRPLWCILIISQLTRFVNNFFISFYKKLLLHWVYLCCFFVCLACLWFSIRHALFCFQSKMKGNDLTWPTQKTKPPRHPECWRFGKWHRQACYPSTPSARWKSKRCYLAFMSAKSA